jgi:hypothetical protein
MLARFDDSHPSPVAFPSVDPFEAPVPSRVAEVVDLGPTEEDPECYENAMVRGRQTALARQSSRRRSDLTRPTSTSSRV